MAYLSTIRIGRHINSSEGGEEGAEGADEGGEEGGKEGGQFLTTDGN